MSSRLPIGVLTCGHREVATHEKLNGEWLLLISRLTGGRDALRHARARTHHVERGLENLLARRRVHKVAACDKLRLVENRLFDCQCGSATFVLDACGAPVLQSGDPTSTLRGLSRGRWCSLGPSNPPGWLLTSRDRRRPVGARERVSWRCAKLSLLTLHRRLISCAQSQGGR